MFWLLKFIIIIFILYLLAIMPKVYKKQDFEPFEGVYYAHRGLHQNKSISPENSLYAFRLAVEQGYGIELDIQLTKDHIPVVFHDFDLKRACGIDGLLKDYTYKELKTLYLFDSKEKIPTLQEVLDLVDGRVPLIVEYKTESTDTTICNIVSKTLSNYKGVYCIESFNPIVLLWYKRNIPKIVRGQLSTKYNDQDKSIVRKFRNFAFENLMLNFLTRPDFIAYNHIYKNNISFVLCKLLYKATAIAYTITSKDELLKSKDHFDLFIFDSFIPDAD